MEQRNQYHHGQLATQLVQQALLLLEQQGEAALSLRSLATMLGVSQTALYAHFRNKAALLNALACQGFQELLQSLQQVPVSAGLATLGQAYLSFAAERPHLYALMFQRSQSADSCAELQQAGQQAMQRLRLQLAGQPESKVLAAWALVHGLALLQQEQLLPPLSAAQRLAVLQHLEEP